MVQQLTIADYHVGIICALPRERTAVELMLDGAPHPHIDVPGGDDNVYTYGSIGKHNVVIASLGAGTYGTVSAAGVANDIRRSFPQLKYGLMVGIAGGMARPGSEDGDIHLGDIVVGCVNGVPSVVNYNLGKDASGGFDVRSELAEPPEALSRAVAALEVQHQRLGPTYLKHLSDVLKNNPRFNRPRVRRDYYNIPDEPDVLFKSDFVHPADSEDCHNCLSNNDHKIDRKPRDLREPPEGLGAEKFIHLREDGSAEYPAVFLGTVGSADSLMRLATRRDEVFARVKAQRKAKLLCFEMEAAGIVKSWPCLVIRGICDYSDSHKNDAWQNFAAVTAAAYAKDLLLRIRPEEVSKAKSVDEVVEKEPSAPVSNAVTFGSGNCGSQIGVAYGPVQLPPERIETPPYPSSINVPALDSTFVNRQALSAEVHMKASVSESRIALVGLGGLGKTQLAIKFVRDQRKRNPNLWVLWIHASNALRFEESVGEVANQLKLYGRRNPKANLLQLLQHWLADSRGGTKRWLVVLDNVDDASFLFEPPSNADGAQSSKRRIVYLPSTEWCSVLITSRTKQEARKLVYEGNLVEVSPMRVEDANELLSRGLGSQYDRVSGSRLAEALEFMPLALSQAISYLQQMESRCTVSQYVKMLERSREARTGLLRQDSSVPQRDRDASNSIILTWQISFAHIQSIRPSAAKLLALMSFCSHQSIPEGLVNVLDSSQGLADSDFEADIRALRAYSFISYNGPELKSWNMHRLVQDSMHWWLQDCDEFRSSEAHYVNRLNDVLPTGAYENWETCKVLLPHVETAVNLTAGDEEVALKQAEVMYKVAWYTWLQGNLNVALTRAEASLALKCTNLREMDESTLLGVELLGLVKSSAGRWSEAEALFVKVMETRRSVLGEEHPDTLTSMANLASTYRNQGWWKEAEQLEVKVMETSRTVLGEEHPNTLTSMANLASTYRDQGRWKKAEELRVKVMETSRTVLGEEHPNTLTSMANLASTYRDQGRWKEAEQLEVKVMETRRSVLGTEHPDTLTSMANLASTFLNQGLWKEAEELGVKVMETRRTVLGEEHPDTLTSMANLASTYRNQGRWKEAEELFVKVMETRRSVLGEEHPDTLTSTANLASTYRNQGRWKEAEQLEVKVMETMRTVLGEEHPDTLTSMNNLASTFLNQGRWKEAEELGVKVMETRRTVLGEEHPSTLKSMANLASTYRNQGRWKEAEEMFVKVMETWRTVLGEEHPDTLSSMNNLASTFLNQGRWKEAEELFVKVMETRRSVLGTEHPDTLTSMNNLAVTYAYQGETQQAKNLMARCVQTRAIVLGANHPDTQSSMSGLQSIQSQLGNLSLGDQSEAGSERLEQR